MYSFSLYICQVKQRKQPLTPTTMSNETTIRSNETTKHTAAPWTHAHGNEDLFTGPDGKDVAYVDTNIPERTSEERAANRRIMRAAPELLEILVAAVGRVEIANAEGNPILSAWLPEAHAIIAKATGKQ